MSAKKVAVLLTGCGYLDGSEIREAVSTLIAIDKFGAQAECIALDRLQLAVVNHKTGENEYDRRNCLDEAARIARGKIKKIDNLNLAEYDALIIPGGFGVAKNFSTMIEKPEEAYTIPEIKAIITTFYKAQKPIGAICIAPIIVALALKDLSKIKVTVGNEHPMLAKCGSIQEICQAHEICFDENAKIVTTPAYMLDAPLYSIYCGIEKMVQKVIELV